MRPSQNSPRNTENSGTPKSQHGSETGELPTVSTPVSEVDAMGGEEEKVGGAAVKDDGVKEDSGKATRHDSPNEPPQLSPADEHIFVKPPLPGHVKARNASASSSDFFNFDFGVIHSTLPSMTLKHGFVSQAEAMQVHRHSSIRL